MDQGFLNDDDQLWLDDDDDDELDAEELELLQELGSDKQEAE